MFYMNHFLGIWKLDKKKSEGLSNILKILKYTSVERQAILNTKLKIDIKYDHNKKILSIKTITLFKNLLKMHSLDNQIRTFKDESGGIIYEKCYLINDSDGMCVEMDYKKDKIYVTDKRTIKDGYIIQEIEAVIDEKDTHRAIMIYCR